MAFFDKTVAKSLLWCLDTTKHDTNLDYRFDCAHRRMVRRMMRLKRLPSEKWLDWHKRSFRRARDAVNSFGRTISSQLWDHRQAWAQHIVRFGLGPRQNHLVKFLLAWRSAGWWNHQKSHNTGPNRVVHHHRNGAIKRYDSVISWIPVGLENDGT